MDDRVTVFSPRAAQAGTAGPSSGLPADILNQSARRLRILAILYATVFFLSGVAPAFVMPEDRARFLGSVVQWLPGVLGIGMALVVAVVVRCPPLPVSTAINLGLIFEVVSSYAIAAAEFGDPASIEPHQGFLGLSWVAVWVLLFTIVVPTSPIRAVVAALASVSSVSVVIVGLAVTGHMKSPVAPFQFFLGLVFPYLLVVAMAYVGSRVMNQLGHEIKRARELGSYQLETKLGEGGMGEVWRARHRMLARPAAVKLIRPEVGAASQRAVQRFEREAQVIARLRSPHTVNLFDFGISDDGAFYYAMELLEGFDADRMVKRFGPMPPDRTIHVLRQVCHSLSEAQSYGLVHRDIKPANIFLCKYGEEFDFVKVFDFGIVRAIRDAAETMPAEETQENVLQGTPAFMAPEQAMSRDIDGRTDIYAVGCLAHWLLTGELVFKADTPMGVLIQHTQAEPVPPSRRTSQSIPKAFDDLVLACLAKDPANRPQTAKELSRRLGEIDGAANWTDERARSWWTEHHRDE